MNIVKNKRIFFIISAIFIIPGIISLLLWGLKLSIEFTGGSRLEIAYKQEINDKDIKKIIEESKVHVEKINKKEKSYSIRTNIIDTATKNKIIDSLKKENSTIVEKSFETVGPSIGKETTTNALKAVIIASFAITGYIAFSFRKVSRPVSSWKYGICAIAALLHDVFIVVGTFSILGHLFGVEIDSLFITAVLTVMGFSVHDTIVVFDRIRENLRKNFNTQFEDVVNHSLLETINRSLNTSITVVLVLLSLIVFGGESIRWFVAALLIGIIAGTYSSIFNASQLLVVLYEIDKTKKEKNKNPRK